MHQYSRLRFHLGNIGKDSSQGGGRPTLAMNVA